MTKIILLYAFGISFAVLADVTSAQERPLEASLLGEWQTLGSGTFLYQYYIFRKNGELELKSIQTKRNDGKQIPPITHKWEGAYIYGQNACKLGDQSGELYIAKESERCCFHVNMIGRTLVLDQMKTDLGSWRGLCESKTLRKSVN